MCSMCSSPRVHRLPYSDAKVVPIPSGFDAFAASKTHFRSGYSSVGSSPRVIPPPSARLEHIDRGVCVSRTEAYVLYRQRPTLPPGVLPRVHTPFPIVALRVHALVLNVPSSAATPSPVRSKHIDRGVCLRSDRHSALPLCIVTLAILATFTASTTLAISTVPSLLASNLQPLLPSQPTLLSLLLLYHSPTIKSGRRRRHSLDSHRRRFCSTAPRVR
jgi:hypothetical protein